MPIYSYECKKCRIVRDVLTFKIDDLLEYKAQCRECGCEMKKLISMSSFRLKGDGWAKDNYASRRGSNNG